MTIQQMLLASGCPAPATVSLTNISLSASDTNGINGDYAGAYFTIWDSGASEGDINYDEYIDAVPDPPTPAFLQTWKDANGGAVSVMLEKSSGDNPNVGSLATWIPLTSYYTWHWWVSGVGTKSFSGTLSIKDSCSGDVLDTCTVTISLTVT